ncbi:hypothetical protein ARMGADRAFT_1062828 [Armillaria gallica]|uniref:Uncharacterized protein n=1 Tax=Armillaria gallica TaxID=47427 RepID=A0A2H3DJ30_ARMGA|nr:hypothetical protein ARMGADRAFT_1062828 [Armillaria gallica]
MNDDDKKEQRYSLTSSEATANAREHHHWRGSSGKYGLWVLLERNYESRIYILHSDREQNDLSDNTAESYLFLVEQLRSTCTWELVLDSSPATYSTFIATEFGTGNLEIHRFSLPSSFTTQRESACVGVNEVTIFLSSFAYKLQRGCIHMKQEKSRKKTGESWWFPVIKLAAIGFILMSQRTSEVGPYTRYVWHLDPDFSVTLPTILRHRPTLPLGMILRYKHGETRSRRPQASVVTSESTYQGQTILDGFHSSISNSRTWSYSPQAHAMFGHTIQLIGQKIHPLWRDGHSKPSLGGIVGNQKFSNIREEVCDSYAQYHENFSNGSLLARRTMAGPKSPRICQIYPRSITSDIDDSEVAPPQSVHDLCSCEIGAEELGHFGRLVRLREVDWPAPVRVWKTTMVAISPFSLFHYLTADINSDCDSSIVDDQDAVAHWHRHLTTFN